MSRYNIPASRINDIIRMVNNRTPKEEAGLVSAQEAEYFDSFEKEASAHFERYGFYPVFELAEIEYDDAILDIYG